jgi:hypothetical protein
LIYFLSNYEINFFFDFNYNLEKLFKITFNNSFKNKILYLIIF